MKKEDLPQLSQDSGVYLFKDKAGKVLYVGKAANLKRRVGSYFSSTDKKTSFLTNSASEVKIIITESVIEALVKEAELIKLHRPPYNIKENDDRSFLYLVITSDEYPRVLLKRGSDFQTRSNSVRSVFGPFIYASEIRSALKIIRKIIPYSTHTSSEIKKKKECLYSQINTCPGVCCGKITKEDYLDNIRSLESFFKGKKKQIIKDLGKKMLSLSKEQRFEEAETVKRRIEALRFASDVTLSRHTQAGSNEGRVEGYDISNLGDSFVVGSLVVFDKGVPAKEEYRLFKIKNTQAINDVVMIQEVLERRLKHNWKLPLLFVVDGGVGQVNAAKKILKKMNINLPIVGVAKGKQRKKEEIVGVIPEEVKKETVLAVQKEAHRFAINYHRRLRKII